MTNKYKNKIKNMNFLSQPRTRTVSKEVSINKIREKLSIYLIKPLI